MTFVLVIDREIYLFSVFLFLIVGL